MIEPAYLRAAELFRGALLNAGFITEAFALKIDPPGAFEPSGDERVLITAASLVKVQTQPVRQILGLPQPRYVIERQCRLELAIAGPNRGMRLAVNSDTLDALAVLPDLNPTLDGLAERFELDDQTDDDLPPNGVSVALNFTIRVRSGDKLGRTP